MSFATHAAATVTGLLDFIFPPHCPVCDTWQPPDDREPLCRACTQSLLTISGVRCRRCSAPMDSTVSSTAPCQNCVSWAAVHFTSALVLTDFVGVAGDAIHKLKFSGIKHIGPFLGRQIAASGDLAPTLASVDLLVPVPLHAARQRERGYNQAEQIAHGLAEALTIPLDAGCVRRCRPTLQQARLQASERVTNTEGAFETARPPAGSPLCIGLVDDVLTTGATLSACAAALSCATNAEIIAVALACPFRHQLTEDGRSVDLIHSPK